VVNTDRATGPNGPLWAELLDAKRYEAKTLSARDIPTDKGVYVWVREGSPVYTGRAKGANGLRDRLRAHLATGSDLSRSTFRSWVAVTILDVPRSVTRQRPSVMTDLQIQRVNDWVASCSLGWVTRPTVPEVVQFESDLLDAWKPPLNR